MVNDIWLKFYILYISSYSIHPSPFSRKMINTQMTSYLKYNIDLQEMLILSPQLFFKNYFRNPGTVALRRRSNFHDGGIDFGGYFLTEICLGLGFGEVRGLEGLRRWCRVRGWGWVRG